MCSPTSLKIYNTIAYPAVLPDLANIDAKLGEVNEAASNAYVDGNLVTTAAWPGHLPLLHHFAV